jgi:hypothetical protein
MLKAAVLCALVLVVTGCGRTYSVAQVRTALAGAGVRVLWVEPVPHACPAPAQPFPSPLWAAEQLMFDLPGVAAPRRLFDARGGTVLVFCGTHDAWRAQQGLRFLREALSAKRGHGGVGTLGADRALAHARYVRRGNVLFLVLGRQPRLDAAAARLH